MRARLLFVFLVLALTVACVVWFNSTPRFVFHNVSLQWVASLSPDVRGYNVYRAKNSQGPYLRLNVLCVPRTSFTDYAVEAGATYYYTVRAVNAAGAESVDSSKAVAVLPAP